MDFSRHPQLYLLIMEANPKSVHTDPVNYTMRTIVHSQNEVNPTMISFFFLKSWKIDFASHQYSDSSPISGSLME